MSAYTDRMGNPISEQQFLQMQGINGNDGLFTSFSNNGLDGLGQIDIPEMTVNSATDTTSQGGLFDGMTAGGFKDIAGGVGSIYQLYNSHKMLGLYEDQVKQSKRALNRNIKDMDRSDANRVAWGNAMSNAGTQTA